MVPRAACKGLLLFRTNVNMRPLRGGIDYGLLDEEGYYPTSHP